MAMRSRRTWSGSFAAAGTPMGALGAQAAALVPGARAEGAQRRPAHRSAGSRGPSAARYSPGASAQARLGAASFVHRLFAPSLGPYPFGAALRASKFAPGEFVGASLNRHTHYHCCIVYGLFERLDDGQVQSRPARAPMPEDVTAITEQVRRRILRWFARSGLLDVDDARDMLAWDNRGFSFDASVRVATNGRGVSMGERSGVNGTGV